MADPTSQKIAGHCVLVVEDEYLIAADLADVLEDAGADVIGPVASVREALELVETFGDRLDGAVLDVNLREERVFPVAEALARRGVPYIFTTGYDSGIIPELHANAPRHQKPFDQTILLRWLSSAVRRQN
jgi:DNA-binding response OmpR family regulator